MANPPTMNNPGDKDIHTPAGADPYPVPKKTERAPNPEDDAQTSTPGNSFERGGVKQDGEYRDAVDEMNKTLKDEGSTEAWKKGRTQN
jgi:hypothetical protein